MKTELRLVTTHVRSVTTVRKHAALSPFGPVRAGLITTQDHATRRASQEAALMELLSSLEREVVTLQSRFYTVYDTLNDVTQKVSALLSASTESTAGTEV